MLSFLREQGLENLTSQKSPAEGGRADRGPQRDKQGQEYLTVSAQRKNVRRSTIMVVIIFGIGLVGLWLMIKRSQPQTASASPGESEETQIEMAIARLTGTSTEMFGRMDQIVEKFYEFSDVLQVNVDDLVKNPFELELFLSGLMSKLDEQEQQGQVDTEMIIQQQIRQRAKGMQLASIMQSDQGTCCMIDNRILYEGDLIRGFKVTQIDDGFVKLQWHGDDESAPSPSHSIQIVLKLSE
jgi:hypothetical protein